MVCYLSTAHSTLHLRSQRAFLVFTNFFTFWSVFWHWLLGMGDPPPLSKKIYFQIFLFLPFPPRTFHIFAYQNDLVNIQKFWDWEVRIAGGYVFLQKSRHWHFLSNPSNPSQKSNPRPKIISCSIFGDKFMYEQILNSLTHKLKKSLFFKASF